jgi:hypothetical protein
MYALWQKHAVRNGVKEEEEELVQNAFEGFCFRCKKKGPKAHECLEKKGRNTTPLGAGGVGKRKCDHCGKHGAQ